MDESLASFWNACVQAVEEALDALVPAGEGVERLREAMRYSLLAGGKRLRPVLAMAACEGAGGSAFDAVPAACALEMVHTYSLIHDDLPAMDDDDVRRGKPTNHKVFGEALAILAGDALLTEAFSVLARAPYPAEIRARLVAELAEAAGKDGMVGGQVLDIAAGGRTGRGAEDAAILPELHRRKTGALIAASVRMGGICAGAEEPVLAVLTEYGRAVGLAYQIVDDLLDVEGDPQVLGKTAGRDAALRKLTWPSVFGVEEARREVDRLTETAVAEASKLAGRGAHLCAIARYLAVRNR
ncbi:MAG: polyprenyl synthetase family protein [Alicyclobacillaceae bacterium]|nr:polyprenyl synthetase family protein [Alicyclobacillaceae bacterium]